MNKLETLGIILDGNRRFARERGLSTTEGHRRGAKKVKEILDWAKELGIKTVFLYAFSTENWQRSRIEVVALMLLLKKFLKTEVPELIENQTRLIFIGDLMRLPPRLKKLVDEAMVATKNGKKFTLVIALSYGGRAEIVAAAKTFAARGGTNEKEFSECLWTAGLPDPDLVVRTGGEKRLSNFLPWQTVYSELYFTPTYWPALTRAEFVLIVKDYEARQRNFGR